MSKPLAVQVPPADRLRRAADAEVEPAGNAAVWGVWNVEAWGGEVAC